MTKAERELSAVLHYSCPRCHALAAFRCKSTDKRRTVMKHPHSERVAKVREN